MAAAAAAAAAAASSSSSNQHTHRHSSAPSAHPTHLITAAHLLGAPHPLAALHHLLSSDGARRSRTTPFKTQKKHYTNDPSPAICLPPFPLPTGYPLFSAFGVLNPLRWVRRRSPLRALRKRTKTKAQAMLFRFFSSFAPLCMSCVFSLFFFAYIVCVFARIGARRDAKRAAAQFLLLLLNFFFFRCCASEAVRRLRPPRPRARARAPARAHRFRRFPKRLRTIII